MKKSVLFFAVLSLLLPFVLLACVVPPAEGTVPGELNELQFWLIGVIASGFVYLLKQLFATFPQSHTLVTKEVLSIAVFIVAGFLSVLWGGIVIPAFAAFSDPITFTSAVLGWLSDFLIAVGPASAFAFLIYNVIMKRLLDAGFAKLSS